MKHCSVFIGQRFGKWTVIKKDEVQGKSRWICRCDCGTVRSVNENNLKRGLSKCCGCSDKSGANSPVFKHGQSNTRLGRIYQHMKERCLNPNNKDYKHYGGRGIVVCDDWLGENGAANFFRWANASGYQDNLTIERINNDLGYSPNNCRWASRKEQANNTRRNTFITIGNETKTMNQWADEYGIKVCTFLARMKSGMNPKDALTTPMRTNQYG